jgi:nucleotide-binding universal stress UspA family protein
MIGEEMTSEQGSGDWSNSVVVGVDGSSHSRAALVWAARQAKVTGAPLTVITTWEYPASFGAPVAWPANIDFEADARSILDDAVRDALGDNPDIEVTKEVIHGHPAVILAEVSRSAGLLVVGSRGHGEFTGMLLGSVSEFLTTHAHCPVVVLREKGVPTAAP